MPDRLTLSCWARGFHSINMLNHWEKLLHTFPFSKLSQRNAVGRVHAVSLREPVLDEYPFAPAVDPAGVLALAREHQHEDCAYELECAWDLVDPGRDFQLAPAPVSLWCFGPGFENETGDQLRIDLGVEDFFLPFANDSRGVRAAQANLQSLTRLVKEIEERITLEKKLLWSESGINFAEKLERIMAQPPRSSARQ
jgi:hypothetical protein